MAKTLDPKMIEAERQTSSRAERREQKRRQMQDEISYNQRGNGVIIIPPQKRRELAEEPPKLRVAAYCRVSTQEEQQVGSFDIPPSFCVCWMRKRGYLRSVPARATNRRASSSPSRKVNRKVLLRFPTRICLTRFALSLARTGFPASATRCVVSGLPMQKPCALTSMKGCRRTFALLHRAMMRNNP